MAVYYYNPKKLKSYVADVVPKKRLFEHQNEEKNAISQIIFVEKNLSCEEISDFCKEFEQFMEYYQNSCRFCSKFVWRKSMWRKNDKYEVCCSVNSTSNVSSLSSVRCV